MGGDDTLFPLEVGNKWTYSVTAIGNGAVCSAGSFDQTVDSEGTIDGRDAYEVTSYCDGLGQLPFSKMGDEVDIDFGSNWYIYIGTPVQAGASWTFVSTKQTWVDAGNVTVPAGTFSNCWTAQQDAQNYATYCRGVGLVEQNGVNQGDGWNAQLTSYSLM